ncbi:MAG: hypothetical protein V4642_01180 [Bacteroidota bacterium]
MQKERFFDGRPPQNDDARKYFSSNELLQNTGNSPVLKTKKATLFKKNCL